MHRTGFLGLWGPKVDSIEVYSKAVGEIEKEILQARLRAATGPPCPTFIALFKCVQQMKPILMSPFRIPGLITD